MTSERAMFHKLFIAFLAWLALAACSSSVESPGSVHRDEGRGPDLAGGTSGSEGSVLPCQQTATTQATLDTVADMVGLSGADLLALANREPQIALRWPARDSGPMFDTSATRMWLNVTARGDAIEYHCDDPQYSAKYRPKPHLELPVVLTLHTDNGVLDARFETVLSAEARDTAKIETLERAPEAVGGTLGQAVAQFYRAGSRNLLFELNFGPSGAYGWIGGPFSPHANAPCAYTEYAIWPPVDSTCNAAYGGMPLEDSGAMRPHLQRINQAFDLTWQDGALTRVTLAAKLAEGQTCNMAGQVSHAVDLHVTTADGRVNASLPATLSGGPVSIDPWPDHLRNIEPFSLDLTASVALDAAALAAGFGFSQPGVSAAIVSLYLSSPVGINSPVLGGGLRVVAIDRKGFADPLPTVTLPGGDSEGCFSATGGQTPALSAEIALH
jgi:hypothetical protein